MFGKRKNGDFKRAMKGLQAFMNGDRETAASIFDEPGILDARDEKGMTPLHSAMFIGPEELVQFLLDRGSDPNAQNNEGETPLHTAALFDRPGKAQLLLARGADPTIRNVDGLKPLFLTVFHAARETMEALLDAGADPLECLYGGQTMTELLSCLILANEQEDDRAAMLKRLRSVTGEVPESATIEDIMDLIQSSADVKTLTRLGRPLIFSLIGVAENRPLELLLERGADPNARDGEGDTALFDAVRLDKTEAVRLLLDHGADPDARDAKGFTPLHYAAYQGRTRAVRLLVKHAKNTGDRQNNLKASPLTSAAAGGHREIARMLVGRTQDLDARDVLGKSARDYMLENGMKDLLPE